MTKLASDSLVISLVESDESLHKVVESDESLHKLIASGKIVDDSIFFVYSH